MLSVDLRAQSAAKRHSQSRELRENSLDPLSSLVSSSRSTVDCHGQTHQADAYEAAWPRYHPERTRPSKSVTHDRGHPASVEHRGSCSDLYLDAGTLVNLIEHIECFPDGCPNRVASIDELPLVTDVSGQYISVTYCRRTLTSYSVSETACEMQSVYSARVVIQTELEIRSYASHSV
jgi:hypothetical protein